MYTVYTVRGFVHILPRPPPIFQQPCRCARSFPRQLRDRQKRFLREIVASPDGVTDSTLRQSFGVKNNKGFGPLLTGISRRAKKVGVSLQDVVVSEKITLSSGEVVLEFKAAPAFLRIAEEGGEIK